MEGTVTPAFGFLFEKSHEMSFKMDAKKIKQFCEWAFRAAGVRASSAEQIYMPGEKEFLEREKSLRYGIKLGDGVWNDLKAVDAEYHPNIPLEECLLQND